MISLPKFISDKGGTLEAVGIEAGKAEVEIILCHLLDVDRLTLFLDGSTLLTPTILAKFDQILDRRATRYPLQYILGEMWFYGRRFHVTPDVMVPTPETEVLCEAALGFLRKNAYACPRILDLGVGSGVISVTLANEFAACELLALDISSGAIGVAAHNALALGGRDRITFRESDFFGAVKDSERFDLILSNPPYISETEYKSLPPEVLADPKISLTSGDEGLDAIKIILRDAPRFLAPGGRIMFEIGYNQADQVTRLTESDPRYRSIVILRDLNDIDRVVILSCEP